jgi:tellurite resistance protein TerC
MTPTSHWLYFHLALVVLLAAEYALHLAVPNTRRKALYAILLWTTAALTLAALIAHIYSPRAATEYLAGYAIEQTLSIDNLFVFLLLFNLFRIPSARQPRVLFWGVAGAILMRGAFIAGGLTLLAHFHWIEYLFAAIILAAAIRLLIPNAPESSSETPSWIKWLTRLQPISDNQDHFFVKESPAPGQPARRMATILLLALVAVELTDVIFALDSIPAVLSITRVPFLAYTSNIMAVMGLRSLYVLLATTLNKLRFIHFGLAALLIFASLKMLLADWLTITPTLSLIIIATLLTLTITTSLLIPKKS